MGLVRTVRQLMREYMNFGNEEVQGLKKQLERQRSTLQQLKAMTEIRKEQEEKLVLLQLRRTVQRMQTTETEIKVEEAAILEALDDLERSMRVLMEAELAGKANAVMQAIDYHEVLTGEKAPESQAAASEFSGIYYSPDEAAPPEAPPPAGVQTSSIKKSFSSKSRRAKNKKW